MTTPFHPISHCYSTITHTYLGMGAPEMRLVVAVVSYNTDQSYLAHVIIIMAYNVIKDL